MLTPNIHAYTQNREIDYENSVSSSKPLGGFINTFSENDKAIAKAILATASTETPETPVSTELWLTIEGFPDYEVSNQGRVKSHKHNRELILQASENLQGYLFVNLFYKGKATYSSLHLPSLLMILIATVSESMIRCLGSEKMISLSRSLSSRCTPFGQYIVLLNALAVLSINLPSNLSFNLSIRLSIRLSLNLSFNISPPYSSPVVVSRLRTH